MIKKDATFEIVRIPLSELRVYEYQKRYPERLQHYMRLLDENTVDDVGMIHVKRRDGGYEILDGHHRYMSLVMMGRVDALCLIITEEP